MPLPWLEPAPIEFPPLEQALSNPNGLLAAGGALSADWLLCAYRQGIFPWYEAGQPVLWWSPDPRLVLLPERLKISQSLRKFVKKRLYTVIFDQHFATIVRRCAESRPGSPGTWITDDMQAAYCRLHELGMAHSVEVWNGADLVGGLYGVALGRVFFGESMFSRKDNTSKLALVYLVKHLQHWGFELIDCQVSSPHLFTLGAEQISRREFQSLVERLTREPVKPGPWQVDPKLGV